MLEETNKPEPQLEQRERLKLIKNTKGYNWEIQILETDISRLIEINNKMVAEFGTQI